MEVIGLKSEYAIEFKVIDKIQLTGYSKLWLKGNFLGSELDLIYLNSYLFGLLDQFCNSKPLNSYFCKINDLTKLYNSLKRYTFYKDKYDASQYECSGMTFTDDFYIFSYLKDSNINILWKVERNPSFVDVKKLGNELYHFKMEKEKFCNLTEQYKRKILSST